MGISQKVVGWLRLQGHDAVHLRDENLQRLPNGKIFQKALLENRIILTVDLDFGEIAALSGDDRSCVIVFRLRNTRPDHVIFRLASILPLAADELHQGAVFVVEESRCRIRRLPVGDE